MNFKRMFFYGLFFVSINLNAWDKDGSPVSTAEGGQGNAKVAALTGGRVVICWEDGRVGHPNYTLYMQVLDSLGHPLLMKDGIMMPDTFGQTEPSNIATNGEDIFIAWADGRHGWVDSTAIYMAKINGTTGKKEWGKDILVCLAFGDRRTPQLCLDGSEEGCYITWTDYRSGDADVWAARVTKEGQVAGEVPVCSLAHGQAPVAILTSGAGCIILWEDNRDGAPGFYGQRVVSDTFQWGANGKLIIPFPSSGFLLDMTFKDSKVLQNPYFYSHAVTDMHGGAIFHYSGMYGRVDTLGNLLWKVNAPYSYDFISNKTSGAIGCRGNWAWYDDPYAKVYAIQLDSMGGLSWGDNFIVWTSPTIDTSGNDTYPTVANAPDNGCVITWCAGADKWSKFQLFCTRLDSQRQKVWTPQIVEVTALPYDKDHPYVFETSDGNYIVIWEDSRNGDWDLYATLVDSSGQVGVEENDMRVTNDKIIGIYPNPFRDITTIKYQVAANEETEIRIYNAEGRLVRHFETKDTNYDTQRAVWDGTNDIGLRLPSGVYFLQLEVNKGIEQVKKVILVE